MRKLSGLCSLALFLLLLCSRATAAAIPQPPAQFYCLDQANILSSQTEAAIISSGANLQAQSGAQIVVVTVANLGGAALEEYALQILRDWGIGDKNKNNGCSC